MYYTVIKHNGHLRTQGKCRKHEPQGRGVFSTFIECSQMIGLFYHRVIHGLGFFNCFKIEILHMQNNRTSFFYVLYSDKTWFFDQSEHVQGAIYILTRTAARLKPCCKEHRHSHCPTPSNAKYKESKWL